MPLIHGKKKGFKGIFEHATGSGKTLTAIYGITKLFLSPRTTGNTVVIIGVPLHNSCRSVG